MTDPTNPDTDDDGMYDGFEYWFTSWDLNENRWGLNPLIETDVNLDSTVTVTIATETEPSIWTSVIPTCA